MLISVHYKASEVATLLKYRLSERMISVLTLNSGFVHEQVYNVIYNVTKNSLMRTFPPTLMIPVEFSTICKLFPTLKANYHKLPLRKPLII